MSVKRFVKKFVSGLVVAGMCVVNVPAMTYANESSVSWNSVNSVITDGGTLQLSAYATAANTTISIPKSVSKLTIIGDASKTYEGLKIETTNDRNKALQLTIENLNINNGVIDIAKTAHDNYLILKGNNNIVGRNQNGEKLPAVLVQKDSNKLIIKAAEKDATLTVQGAEGCAGIGGKENGEHDGEIIIEGGHITAKGGKNAPGIGAGAQRRIKSITITGDAVIESSVGGENGAGIGGSSTGDMIENITISGNALIKEAKGGNKAAGIGAGDQSGVKNLNIIGGTIENAIGGSGAAGIGSGANDKHVDGMKISITNAKVIFAQGGENGAGIGGGYERGAHINIGAGAYIEKAIGGANAAGIGSGPKGEQRTITIEDKSFIKLAQGGVNGAGIGGGQTRSATITINGGNIEHAKGGANAAGIGCGEGNNDATGTVTIKGGVIYAEGGSGTATNDIGAGNYKSVEGGKSQQDAKGVKVYFEGGAVFTPNDTVIGGEPGKYKNYDVVAYNIFDKDSMTGELYSNGKIYIRTEQGMNKELVTGGDGHTTFSWEDPEEEFKGLWIQKTDESTGKIYVATIATKTETDDGRETWKDVYYDIDNKKVAKENKFERNLKEMPITFAEAVPGDTPTFSVSVTPAAGDNKLVPYSMSNISFNIDVKSIKTSNPNVQSIKKLECVLDTVAIANGGYSIKFAKDESKVDAVASLFKRIGATEPKTYSHDEDLNDLSKFKYENVGDDIKITCTGNWLESEDFRIVAYIKTEDPTKASGEIVQLSDYKKDLVDAAEKTEFNVKGIKVTVECLEPVYHPDKDKVIVGYMPVDREITLPDSEVDAYYSAIPTVY